MPIAHTATGKDLAVGRVRNTHDGRGVTDQALQRVVRFVEDHDDDVTSDRSRHDLPAVR